MVKQKRPLIEEIVNKAIDLWIEDGKPSETNKNYPQEAKLHLPHREWFINCGQLRYKETGEMKDIVCQSLRYAYRNGIDLQEIIEVSQYDYQHHPDNVYFNTIKLLEELGLYSS